MLQKPMEESYKEYIALTILLVSVNVNFFSLVKHSDKGKLKLINLFAYSYSDLCTFVLIILAVIASQTFYILIKYSRLVKIFTLAWKSLIHCS